MNDQERLVALAEAATDLYADDDINIDPLTDDSEISEGSDGIWVRAWVHVPNSELEERGIDNPEAS